MSQFADDSMTPPAIKVGHDKFGNEIPSDRPMHGESTPGQGGFDFACGHYDDGPSKGGFSSYGKSAGGANEVSRSSVDADKAGRGKE